ncbi:MAG: serine/threonine protein kinase, partial [Planctomycetes bacterium]|nr:serine/threonine protein kinase [Planctomycetota bacterium]
MADASESRIDELVERCILALDDGDQTAVDRVLAEHPEDAAELRERLGHLEAIGLLHPPRDGDLMPERLGEFRLVRQIGRGGMGAVFVAEQESLRREVALKLVRPDQVIFGGTRERFRREVLAIARLQHPGIVPILTGGEAQGIPFYAMELVHGASLAEVLEELTGNAPSALDGTALRAALARAMAGKQDDAAIADAAAFHGAWVQVCCRLMLDVAEAVQHAHERGVLHRDLKPSNVLLTTAGDARVIDFGLASAEGEQRITRSGASFGSVPYMAPEQVRGQTEGIDERTDVYGLGVTLYELLTLRLPFGDGASSRERILTGDYEPPARRNALVHPDVDAICSMAMDVDAPRRYASAAEFAADLRAFLEQRTVRARRPSAWLRARRWTARNPMRAAVAIVLFLALVPGPLLFAWQRSVAATEIQRALDVAEQGFDQALAAVDQMLLRTAEARLADVPRTAELRRQLLQDAVEFHERLVAFANEAGDNRRAREAAARSRWRLGALQGQLGNLTEARALLERARDGLEDLIRSPARRAAMRPELASCCLRLGRTCGNANDLAAGEVAQRRAIELYDETVAETGNRLACEDGCSARIDLAMTLGKMQRDEEAVAILADLDRRLAAPGDLPLDETQRLAVAAHVADRQGILLEKAGHSQAALARFEAALARLEQIPRDSEKAERRENRAFVGLLERLGLMLHQRREWRASNGYLDRALAEYERLVAREPEVPNWQNRLASLLGTHAANARLLGHPEAAGADHDRAVAILEEMVRRWPDDVSHVSTLAIAYAERAAYREQMGQIDDALADFAAAAERLEACIAARPDDPRLRANLVAVQVNRGQTLVGVGRSHDARPLIEVALEAARAAPSSPEGDRKLIEMLDIAAEAAFQDDDNAAARALSDECGERVDRFYAAKPDDPVRQRTAVMMHLNRGLLLHYLDDEQAAASEWEAGLEPGRRATAGSE